MVEASPSTIEPGAAIVLDGLQAKPSLNGRAGTVLDFDDESGRWGVALPKDERPFGGDETKIKVKPENIRLHIKTPPTVPSSSLADSLHARGFAVCDGLLEPDEADALMLLLLSLRDGLNKGDVAGGRAASAYARITGQQMEPRGDLMRFLSAEDAMDHDAFIPVFRAMDAAVASLQASPFLANEWKRGESDEEMPPPLKRDEMQVTCYPGGGARYVRHVDNNTDNGWRVTCILYANPMWEDGDGGELRLYPTNGLPTDVVDVAPLHNRLVLFWSDARVPHEVLPSRVDRYALSIWYEDPKPPGPVDDGSPYFLGE